MKLSCLGHAFFVFWSRLVQMEQILHTCLRRIKWRLNKLKHLIGAHLVPIKQTLILISDTFKDKDV